MGKTDNTSKNLLLWLVDIEIGKIIYLLSFVLLGLEMFLVTRPMFQFTAYGATAFLTLHEHETTSWMTVCVFLLNIVAMCSLLVPMMKSFEWRYCWFIPTATASAVELIGLAYLLNKVDEILQTTLVGYIYQLFSVEVKLTTSVWALILTIVLTMLCAFKMLVDIRENYEKYPFTNRC